MTVRMPADTARVSRLTRAKLLVLLPLTMALLVAATGFFAMSTSGRYYQIYGANHPAIDKLMAQVGLQIALVAVVAAVLGLGMAIGVTRPLRQVADRLEAIASGDLRAALDIRSTSELDSLAGAFNDAIGAINRYIFQSMTGAVVTLNTDGMVIGSSPAAEVILGYREEELVGKSFSEVFAPASGGRAMMTAIQSAIAKRHAFSVEDIVIAGKDGRPIRIGLNVSYLRGADRGDGRQDEAVGVTIAFKDLTEIRRLRERLQQADQLVALGTLTAGVAHELRNPLASLQGLAELIGRDFGESDPRRLYVKTMLESIDRLNRLVEELLLFSSPGPRVMEDVDVNDIARDTVMFVRLGLGERQLDLTTVDGSNGTRPLVAGSRERLGQALANIVLNGVQATPDGGHVTVRTAATDRQAVIAVHNTGSYIPPDRRKQLFRPFFTTKPSGTGLGLAIAQQIVTAHGGRIEVASDEDSGTTFTVELPLTRDAVAVGS